MNKRFIITEEEREQIRSKYFFEQSNKEDERHFCHKGNTKTLEDIIGSETAEDYISGIKLRPSGVNGLTDMLELLKSERMIDPVSDQGKHVAFKVMNILKGFKPYNYFDETNKKCGRVMDKIIELYKENIHGEELVKDIEKVYEKNSSPFVKEYMKQCLNLIKGE